MKLDNLEDVLEAQIKDLYSAEIQLVKFVPKILKRASSVSLKEALESHLSETEQHVDKIKSIAVKLGLRTGGKRCRAMEGLLVELKDVVGADGRECAVDLALIAMMQRIEHYEISAYGSARSVALQLGYEDIVMALQEILEEESSADERLTQISLDEVLPECAEVDEDEEKFTRRTPRLSDRITN